ncbi:MAG: DUF2793 domain-containing protein [Pseudomonadota bacterium]
MSDFSPNLAMPFIMPAQAQKHVTHNEAVEVLDTLVQMALEATGAETPPATPAEGQAWGLGAAPTGDWAGQAGAIASYRGGGWEFYAPGEGWIGWVKDAGELRVHTGGAWATLAVQST